MTSEQRNRLRDYAEAHKSGYGVVSELCQAFLDMTPCAGAAPSAASPQPQGAEPLDHYRNCGALSLESDHCPGNCTCGLQWRIALQTEQAMHAAWRKRAEEAESKLNHGGELR